MQKSGKKASHLALITGLVAVFGLLPGLTLAQAELEEMVVTAQKRAQSLQDVPVSVAAMGKETLEVNQFKDFRQILSLTPSVNFQAGFTPSATNFNIRGLGSFAFTEGVQPAVALGVDGVSRARNGEFVFNLADIERIEVLRGPQGTLFGRGSTGGAINVITASPAEEFYAEVEVGGADDGEKFIRGVISGALSDNVRGRLAAMYLDRDGYITNVAGSDLGGEENKAFRGKLDIDASENVTVRLSADYSINDHSNFPLIGTLGSFTRTDAVGGLRENFSTNFGRAENTQLLALGLGDEALGRAVLNDPFTIAQDYAPTDQQNIIWGVSATVDWEISDTLKLVSISGYREYTNDNAVDVDLTPGGLANLDLYPFITIASQIAPRDPSLSFQSEHDYFQQEIRLEGSGENYEWLLDGFYQKLEEASTNGRTYLFDISAFSGAPFGSTWTCGVCDFADNLIEQDTLAVYADINYSLTDKLDIFAGVRYTEEDATKILDNGLYEGVVSGDYLLANQVPGAVNTVDFSGAFGTTLTLVPAAQGTASAKFDFTSYRLGLSYNVSSDVNLYVSANRGNVGPAFPVTRGDVLVDDPVSGQTAFLVPSQADNIEIGLKSELLDNRLSVNVAIFDMDVSDLQTQLTLPGTISPVTINGGDLESSGIEVDATYAATDWLTLSAGLARVDATSQNLQLACYEDQLAVGIVPCAIDANGDGTPESQDISGRQTVNTPEFAYTLAAAVNLPIEGTSLDFYGNANYSWRDDIQYQLNQDDLTIQDSYGILDITLGVRDQSGKYEIYLYDPWCIMKE